MAQQAMTVRLDANMKSQFDSLCEQFGMSANTAINLFVNKVVRSKCIPFIIDLSENEETSQQRAANAFARIREKAMLSEEPEMSLEEINEEIRLVREERKMRLGL